MLCRFRTILLVSVVVVFLCASPVRAECVAYPGQASRFMANAGVRVLFSGTVVTVTRTADEGYRATFDVDRVWKGTVAKRFDVYVWERMPEIPHFEVGRQYTVVASQLIDPRARQGAGLTDTNAVAFTPVPCTNSLWPTLAEDLGPGRAPID
jgi:hypothetical protein